MQRYAGSEIDSLSNSLNLGGKIFNCNFLDAIDDRIYIQDKDYRILFQNKQARDFSGDCVGRLCYEAFHGRTEICDDCPVEKCLHDGLSHKVEKPIKRDGRTFYFDTTISPISDLHGSVIAVIKTGRDITANRESEATLRLYEQMVSASTDRQAFVDRNYIYKAVNDAFVQNYNLPRNEIIGRHVAEILGQETFDSIVREKLDLCFSGQRVVYRSWFNMPDRPRQHLEITYHPHFEHDGIVTGAAVNIRDITERVLSAEALKLYERMISASTDIQSFIDRDYVYKAVNDAFLRLHGKTRDEVIGRHMQELLGREIFENALKDNLDQCFLGQKVSFQRWHDLPNQKKLCFEVTYYPHFGPDGAVTGAAVNVRDTTERVQAEEALRQYERIVSASTDLLALVDSNYIYRAVNDAYIDMFNKPRNEIVGRHVRETLGDRIFEEHVRTRLDRCFNKREKTQFDAWLTIADGSKRFFAATYHPCFDATGAVIAAAISARDLTEHRLAEMDLKKSKESLEAVLKGMKEIVFVTDVANCDVIFHNKAATSVFGGLAGKSCQDLLQGNDAPACGFCNNSDNLKFAKHSYEIQYGLDARWYSVSHNMIQWIDGRTVCLTIAQDITERKKAEESLLLLVKAVNTTKTGISFCDLDNTIRFTNNAYADMHGYEPSELEGRNLRVIAPQKSTYDGKDILSMRGSWTGEGINLKRNGNEFPVRVMSDIVRSEDGQPIGFVTACEDISEQRTMEQFLRDAEAQAAKGVVAAEIAHEINNSLANLETSLYILSSISTPPRLKENLHGELKAEIYRMSGIVTSILEMYRPDGAKVQPLDLNLEILKLITLVGRRLKGRGVEISTSLSRDLPTVLCHPGHIRQVLLNIIKNAEESMIEAPGKRIEFRTMIDGLRLIVSIGDTGVGIPEDILNKIVNAGYSTKLMGTGLGLAISRNILAQYGASLDIQSRKNEGTTVTVSFPLEKI